MGKKTNLRVEMFMMEGKIYQLVALRQLVGLSEEEINIVEGKL